VVIKKDLDEDKAKKYQNALEGCGMIARLDEIAAEAEIDNGLSMIPMEENEMPMAEETTSSDEGYVEQPTEINNPYATPEAALARNSIRKDGQGTLEGGINGDYDFTIGDIFSEGWERTKGAKGTFVLAWVLYMVVAMIINLVTTFVFPDAELLIQEGDVVTGMVWSMIPSVISIPLLYPIMAGLTLLGIHRSVDADIEATSVFSHYDKIIPISIAAILMYFLTVLGLVLLIIPGIYLMIAYMMSMALIIDKGLGVWEAMEASRKAISKHWFKIFFIYLLIWLLMIVAALPLLIGLIWVIPLATIMHGIMYKYMFGVDSVE